MKLQFQEHKTKFICEVFGMNEKTYDMLCDGMNAYFDKLEKADNMSFESKTQCLQEYINSGDFKDMHFPLNSANNLFMFGYIFSTVLERRKGEGFAEFMRSMVSHVRSQRGSGNGDGDDDEGELPN